MTDIVERLGKLEAYERELAHECDCPPEATANWAYADICAEAASEITRLKAEVERLRAALEMFACDCAVHERCVVPDNCRNFQARRALNKKPRK
jgi:hypothetical protein